MLREPAGWQKILSEPGSQRLFFALWPDAQIRERLAGIRDRLPAHGGRPTHIQDLHITLNFLGQVGPDRYDCLVEAAGRVRIPPFSLLIDSVGYWRRPRLLWSGPSQVPAELEGLVRALRNELKGCGFKPETRTFRPHVTLARKTGTATACQLEKGIAWDVKAFSLITSDSGKKVPRYRVLKNWPLGL